MTSSLLSVGSLQPCYTSATTARGVAPRGFCRNALTSKGNATRWLQPERASRKSRCRNLTQASIGLYYTTGTCDTEKVAKKIKDIFGPDIEEISQIRAALPTDLGAHDGIILGLPSYLWDEFSPVSGLDFDSIMPPISKPDNDLEGVKVAIFALGDQVGYPDNFADAAGTLWEKLEQRGATLIGKTSLEGYTFKRSRAVLPQSDEFVGLIIDNVNQADLTDERLDAWTAQLKEEFGLLPRISLP